MKGRGLGGTDEEMKGIGGNGGNVGMRLLEMRG